MRLTNKVGIDYIYGNFVSLNEPHKSVANKLGQLEDIEEELGIDLITLFKALKNGAIFNCDNGDVHFIELKEMCIAKGMNPKAFCKPSFIKLVANDIGWFLVLYNEYPFSTKDYGKTWALTKEELE